jgi:hypothetical protein
MLDMTARSIGYVFLVAVAFVICALAISAIDWIVDRHRRRYRFEGAQTLGNEILSAAWWVGSSPDAVKVLRIVGQSALRYGTVRPDNVREEFETASSTGAPERES